MRAAIARIVVCTVVFTGGCGVKGPLYLPGVPRDAPWPYRTSKPAQAPAPASPAPAPTAPSAAPAAPAADAASAAPAPAAGGAPGQAPEGKP